MKEIIARNFKLLRNKLGITQIEMAEYLDLSSREVISYYENGDRDIPLDILEKCCNLFGVELIELFEENEAKVKTNIHFAFRADDLEKEDLKSIADFKEIMKNYGRMKQLMNRG
ncbi:helix-turn-helix domain-containing protein [Zunongwangia endophytica]|uniref:Helix-turn-helix domain-containing protein n=1 Tax=Zunongwangia endophytica TaxID=1808945 RepID=A0ABV8H4W4_9FLAO|nr:helix-turn-helix transcriptional regulator [Zunongwangia endophytica]MDN3595336.1 helix-turn-helix transcriptional regulator [Zunongwangia endophytica]